MKKSEFKEKLAARISTHEPAPDVRVFEGRVCTGDQFVIIRAISDKADDSEEMNYELFKKDAAEHCASVVRYMITHD